MLLENNPNYSHLQRSIDTLRSLGDRLGDRNVDLRLNLHHQDLRNNDRLSAERNLNLNDSGGGGRGGGATAAHQGLTSNLELNLSLNSDRLLQERNLERLINERTLQEQRMNLDHNLSLERLNLERSLSQNLDRTLNDRNLNLTQNNDRNLLDRMNSERGGLIDRNINSERTINDRNLNTTERTTTLMDRNLSSDRGGGMLDRNLNNLDRGFGSTDRLTERLRMDPIGDMRHNSDINDLKYREYKAHLENLRSESSRSLEGRAGGGGGGEEERGTTPSTPPTPISVGENFQEEKVFIKENFLFFLKIFWGAV